jgi:uncharacterized membrane protein YcfT
MPETASRPAAIPPAAPAPGQARERLGWIDTARGLTMLMVVLLHADIVAQAMGRQELAITLFNYLLFPLRMPMFFLVSGLLAAGLMRRPAGEVMRRRVLHYAWLYALWSLLYAGIHAWALRDLGPPGMQEYYNNVEGPLEALLVTWNNTWFLYALMLFFAVALLLRPLPPAAQMAIGLALAVPGVLGWGEAIGLPVLDRFYHFPYFLLGILASERLRAAAPWLGRLRVLLPLLLCWLVLGGLAHMARILRDPAVVAALSLLAVPAGLGLAVWLSRHLPPLAVPLQVVGRNTLAIYVLHTITLRVLMALVPHPEWLPGLILLPVLTLLAVAIALAFGRVLERVPFLFGLPGTTRRPAGLARA